MDPADGQTYFYAIQNDSNQNRQNKVKVQDGFSEVYVFSGRIARSFESEGPSRPTYACSHASVIKTLLREFR